MTSLARVLTFLTSDRGRRIAATLTASSLVAIGLIGVSSPPASAAGCGDTGLFGGGTGVAGDPYLMSEASHVDYLRSNAGTYGGCEFEQVTNISMGNTTWSVGGIPVFSGTYDGGGYAISDLSISVSRSSLGLFESVSGTITDLGFAGSVRRTATSGSQAWTGGLVGQLDGGTITDSYATGSVQSEFSGTSSSTGTGGLVGRVTNGGVVEQSYATGSVMAATFAGGLVGNALLATIRESYATGSVTVTTSTAGGLVGFAIDTDIERSFATGNVTGTNATVGQQHFAGFVGSISGGSTITDSYATGSVTVGPIGTEIGGFVGDAGATATDSLTRTFSATTNGIVAAGAPVDTVGGYGGIQRNNTTVVKSFWNSETASLVTRDWGDLADDSDIKAKNTTALKDFVTYTDGTAGFDWNAGGATVIAEGYDANHTWGICSAVNNGYPFLTAFYSTDPCSGGGGGGPATNGAVPAEFEFTFTLPDGTECLSISPVTVVDGTDYTLPGVDADCRTMPGATVGGWTIPVPEGFTGAGSSALPFNPTHVVEVSAPQTFTVVPFEPVIVLELDANVNFADSCTPTDVEDQSLDHMFRYKWVPRDLVTLARLPKQASCEPEGYTLVGWNLEPNGEGQSLELNGSIPDSWGTAPANRHHLFAMWQRDDLRP